MGNILERFGRRRTLGVIAALFAVVVASGVALIALGGGEEETSTPAAQDSPTTASSATPTGTATPTPEASPTPIKHAGILDGAAMSDEEWEARKDLLPLAVMIDNTTGAVPHAGLNKADLVYEAFVEGGITRLMAVYWRQDAEKILPVRSARTPFVIWVSELAAMYGHAGGSTADNEANAISQIIEYGIRDLNAFTPGPSSYYYRDGDRHGPYDLATSTNYLREAAAQLGFAGPPTTESWVFRDPLVAAPKGERAEGIEVDFSGRLYAWQYIQWKWDGAAKRYLRSQFGGPQLDATTGEQIGFATVIVMTVPERVVDDDGHVVLEQYGSGPATVFTGGQAFPGTWQKKDRQARTRFYDANRVEIVFERGPIFIEVLGQQSGFEYVADAKDLRELPKYELPPPGTPGTDVPEETPTLGPTATAEVRASPSPSRTTTPVASPSGSATAPASPSPATPTPTATPPQVSPSPIGATQEVPN